MVVKMPDAIAPDRKNFNNKDPLLLVSLPVCCEKKSCRSLNLQLYFRSMDRSLCVISAVELDFFRCGHDFKLIDQGVQAAILMA